MRHLALALSCTLLPCLAFAQSDSDTDGVADAADAFPCDSAFAQQAFHPAEGQYGALLFEDEWPNSSDMDFNDVALAHHLELRGPAGGYTWLQWTFEVRALGGVFDNGLGVQLPVPASDVAQATVTVGGQQFTLTPRVEDTQATFHILDDLRVAFGGQADQINSLSTLPRQTGQTIVVDITFARAVNLPLAEAPFDVFIFRTGQPQHQVHRPEYRGTALMDAALFNTGIDQSTPSRAFVESRGVPFALEIPQLADSPLEAIDVAQLYPDILLFGSSGGVEGADYYLRPVDAAAYKDVNGLGLATPPALSIPPADQTCVTAALIACHWNETYSQNGGKTHTFTAAECGGVLPDANYVGALASATQCGRDEDWRVIQPNQSGGPGMGMWNGSDCGSGSWGATFVERGADVTFCQRAVGGASNGSNTVRFSASDCGGALPGPNHVGVLSAASQCGRDEDWRALDANEGGAGMSFWMSGVCNGGTQAVTYLDLSSPRFAGAIICKRQDSGYNAGNGGHTFRFSAADCGGALPGPGYEPLIARAGHCGRDQDWRALTHEDGGAGLSFWLSSACANLDVEVVYLPR